MKRPTKEKRTDHFTSREKIQYTCITVFLTYETIELNSLCKKRNFLVVVQEQVITIQQHLLLKQNIEKDLFKKSMFLFKRQFISSSFLQLKYINRRVEISMISIFWWSIW